MKKKEKQMLALVDVQAAKSIWTPLLSYICEFLIIVSLFHWKGNPNALAHKWIQDYNSA